MHLIKKLINKNKKLSLFIFILFIISLIFLNTIIVNGNNINRSYLYSNTTLSFIPILEWHPKFHDFGNVQEDNKYHTNFEIWNNGTGNMSWLLDVKNNWIEVEPISGYSTGEHDIINVTINTSNLKPGDYEGNVYIHSEGDFIYYTYFHVTESKLSIYPKYVNMGNILKNNFYSFDLKIWNDGLGILNWFVYSNMSYIYVNPSNGSSTDEYSNIKVILNTNNLTSGDYHEIINIVSDGGDYNFLLNFTINSPPDNPKIQGEANVKSGEESSYEIFSHDPNGDNISYLIDWGDDSNYNWSIFITSDEVYNITKIWNNKGIYIIRVKAKDIYNEESSWTTLEIEVPKNYFINNFFFKFVNLLLKF